MNYLLCISNQAVLAELAEKIGEKIQSVEVGSDRDHQKGISVTTETIPKTESVRKNNTHCFAVLHHGKWRYVTIEEIFSPTSGI